MGIEREEHLGDDGASLDLPLVGLGSPLLDRDGILPGQLVDSPDKLADPGVLLGILLAGWGWERCGARHGSVRHDGGHVSVLVLPGVQPVHHLLGLVLHVLLLQLAVAMVLGGEGLVMHVLKP